MRFSLHVLHHHYQHDSGEHALANEKCWLTPLVVRSDKFKTISGGWSAILAAYLKAQLLGAEGGLSTVGLGVALSDSDVKIFAKLKSVLSDGDGLHPVQLIRIQHKKNMSHLGRHPAHIRGRNIGLHRK